MMNVGDYLLATIERIAKRLIVAREPLCLTGEVTAVDPLKIRVKNYELTEEHLVLDVRCTEQWIKIPKDGGNEHLHEIDAETETATTGINATTTATVGPAGPATVTIVDSGHKHKIKIETKTALPEICLWRKLRKGDKVRIIRLEGGAIHWVTGRIEDNIANDSDEDGGKYGTT